MPNTSTTFVPTTLTHSPSALLSTTLKPEEEEENKLYAWLAALVSITIISMVGLLAVVVVPLLERINYRFVLHYFVAVAVGALTGDALLHLLPHSLYEAELKALKLRYKKEGNETIVEAIEIVSDLENTALMKGVAGICGILIFFVSQRIMMLVADIRRRKKLAEKLARQKERQAQAGAGTETTTNTRTEIGSGGETAGGNTGEETKVLIEGEGGFERRPVVGRCESNPASAISAIGLEEPGSDVSLIALRAVGEVSTPGNLNLEERLKLSSSLRRDSLAQQFGLDDDVEKPHGRSSPGRLGGSGGSPGGSVGVRHEAGGGSTTLLGIAEVDETESGNGKPLHAAEQHAEGEHMHAGKLLDEEGGKEKHEHHGPEEGHQHAHHEHGHAEGHHHKHDAAHGNEHHHSHEGKEGAKEQHTSPEDQGHGTTDTKAEHAHDGHAKNEHDKKHEHGKEHKHDDEHGHGHGHEHGESGEGEDEHGHSHKVPSNVKSLMTMVVLGDGLHNITDGLAVGAAFAGGVSGGISTAIAVFCHELPHELGDFAVLLKAGMSLRTALFFNLLSSLLSLIGCLLGVLLGTSSKSANDWLYPIIAGIFIFIALVNMLPELNPTGDNIPTLLLIQLAGVLTGQLIMFLIAHFEDSFAEIPKLFQ